MGLFSFPGKNQQDADDDLDAPVKPRRSRRSPTQDEEPVDPMLPEKQRARRRLIGATALVLAAIIGLPMIFDADPNKPLADDVETQIPDKISPAPESLKPQPAPQSVTQKVVESPVPAQPPAPSQPVSELKAAPEPAKTVKSNTEASEKPASGKTSEGKAPVDEDKPQSKEKARKYLLQVAAVNSKTKADDLKSRLKESGIKAYSEKISTKDGDRFRVRVGPFASREEAEKMQARVKKMGLNGSVQSM
jgi:DedD protein